MLLYFILFNGFYTSVLIDNYYAEFLRKTYNEISPTCLHFENKEFVWPNSKILSHNIVVFLNSCRVDFIALYDC